MASSSSASIHKSFKYDVFLSFRGEDTRTNFIDHLYDALNRKGICTYKDDETIRKGKRIGDELMGSIEDSQLYIIVFSKNYASSSWCLDELVRIMECQKTTEHTAYPIFYDVEPTEVRKQSRAVGKAFAKHQNDESAGKWREALTEAADLVGWELKKTANGHEAKFIQIIVEDISQQLRFTDFYIDEKLVGMKTRVEDVLSYMGTSSDVVRIIGINGMGGSGKTTLAKAIFDQISYKFEGKSFVENVREVSNNLSGLRSLQNQVLKDVLNDRSMTVNGVHQGKCVMEKMMSVKKVLVVLDDVDHQDQLEALAGDSSWFKAGSIIIITTRDEQVLVAHKVKLIIDIDLLSSEEAICLFSRNAFGGDIPIEGYKELCGQVVRYAAGHPLTIKVLGSSLCNRDKREWIEALERLKEVPVKETLKILELSYSSIDHDHQEIFLNVACMMKGWRKDIAIEVLSTCGLHATLGISVLKHRSLITIFYKDNVEYVGMHDQLEEMGKNIVRRFLKPKEHSHLWKDNEIEDILANDLGTNAIKYIRCNMLKLDVGITMKGLRKMEELKFLHVYPDLMANFATASDNVSQYLPNALVYLHWFKYPLRSLPNTFQGDNLFSLKMVSSEIVQLWEGGEKKVLKKLKVLDLKNSRLRTLDLELFPELNTLSLGGCFDLVQLHNLDGCLKLISVDLSGSKLKSVNLHSAVNLTVLHLKKCNELEELHLQDGCLNLTDLRCTQSKLMKLDIRLALNIKTLILDLNSNLIELQMPGVCPDLITLRLSNSMLNTLDIGLTPNLEDLDLRNCNDFESLKMAGKCENLKSLDVMHSKLRTLDIGLTPNLKSLNLNNRYRFEDLHIADKCEKLVFLDISDPKSMTLEDTPNLQKLDLKEYNDSLQYLVNLDLSGSLKLTPILEKGYGAELHVISKSLERCPLHPDNTSRKLQYEYVYKDDSSLNRNLESHLFKCLCACTNIDTHSESICGLQPLKKLEIDYYRMGHEDRLEFLEELSTKDIDQLEYLEELRMSYTWMKCIPDWICKLKHLKILHLGSCQFLRKLPEDFGQLESLEEVRLSANIKDLPNGFCILETLPDSFCMLKNLKALCLERCILLKKLPEDFGQLECLEELRLSGINSITHLPDSFCMLKNLKALYLDDCPLLEKLPKDFGQLECLEKVTLLAAQNIKHLPDSFCMLKHLKILNISYCESLEKLPEDLDGLESLEDLTLRRCFLLQDIPNSICKMKCLKELVLQGSNIRRISHIPHNIRLLNGVRVTRWRRFLLSCGFTLERVVKWSPTLSVDE